MRPLRTFLGKLFGDERSAPAAAASTAPIMPAQAEAIAPAAPAEEADPPMAPPERPLTPITDIRIEPAAPSPEAEAPERPAADQLVMVYSGKDLLFDVTEEMKPLNTTDFVSRLIDQAYEKYELLFDTDDIFEIVMLLKKARPQT